MQISDFNPHNLRMTEDIESNLNTLMIRIRLLLGKIPTEILHKNSFSVTSGLRSVEQQNKLVEQGKSRAKTSMHVIGAAADLYDPRSELDEWVSQNVKVIEDIGLWFEHKNYTPNWSHIQIYPPQSGKRFFIP